MIDFFSGMVCGMTLVGVITYRLLSIARETVKLREVEVMQVAKALDEERKIPKRRERGTFRPRPVK